MLVATCTVHDGTSFVIYEILNPSFWETVSPFFILSTSFALKCTHKIFVFAIPSGASKSCWCLIFKFIYMLPLVQSFFVHLWLTCFAIFASINCTHLFFLTVVVFHIVITYDFLISYINYFGSLDGQMSFRLISYLKFCVDINQWLTVITIIIIYHCMDWVIWKPNLCQLYIHYWCLSRTYIGHISKSRRRLKRSTVLLTFEIR